MAIGTYRWRIAVLVFFATTINYIDRQVLGMLAPTLQEEFAWSESDYGFIVASFQIAYAVGLLLSGRLLDRVGVKIGYSIAVAFWSFAGALHAFATGLFSFAGARVLLGLGEAANFPAAVKTVAEWFPKKERALATGIFNSGSNFGAIIAPLLVPWIALHAGWQWAFIGTGALGLVWLIFWRYLYSRPEESKRLSSTELAYIKQDEILTPNSNVPSDQVSLTTLLFRKQTIGIALSLFVTSPIWWFFLYWLPKFLYTNLHIDIQNMALPLIIIYVVSDVGAIVGGWLSSFMIKHGVEPIKARKRVILGLAFLPLPIIFAAESTSLWLVVTLISMATFAHQGYASNIFTIISDVFPKHVVGRLTGLVMFFGSIGGVLFSTFAGLILEVTGTYYILFAIAASAYLLSWLFLRFLVNEKVEELN